MTRLDNHAPIDVLSDIAPHGDMIPTDGHKPFEVSYRRPDVDGCCASMNVVIVVHFVLPGLNCRPSVCQLSSFPRTLLVYSGAS